LQSSSFDVNKARGDTRACQNIIHFNNAGAALMPAPVSDCLHQYLDKEEQIGGYETQNEEQALLSNFYRATAKLLNCHSEEIAFIENATRAWDMAFYSFGFSPGDKILTTIAEYGSNVIAYLHQAKKSGVKIEFVANDQHGQIDVQALSAAIDDKVKLISISHIPTGGGLVNPAEAVGKIANAAGIPFLLDACQSIGQLPLDVEQIGCDILTGTGRKYLRGPRGTGLLYVRKNLIEKLDPPFLDQHAATLLSAREYSVCKDAKRFENWEQNYAGKAALGAAIDYALSFGIDNIQTRVYALADNFREQLKQIDGLSLTDEGLEQCGIVTFQAEQLKPTEIKQQLRDKRINVTAPTGSGNLVSFQQRGLDQVVRASIHYYNTEEEIDNFINMLKEIFKL
jgi:selenocysteine lyase/cysteine desulfurase